MTVIYSKEVKFSIDEESDGRTVTAVAYVMDEETDRHGDTFALDAFDEYIASGAKPKILAYHDKTAVIGKWSRVWVDGNRLMVRGRILETSAGNDMLVVMKDESIDAVSIGLDTEKSKYVVRDDGGLHWTKAVLAEVSPVPFPAKESARIIAIKSRDGASATDVEPSFARLMSSAVSSSAAAKSLGMIDVIKSLAEATGLEELELYALMIDGRESRLSAEVLATLAEELGVDAGEMKLAAERSGFDMTPADDTQDTEPGDSEESSPSNNEDTSLSEDTMSDESKAPATVENGTAEEPKTNKSRESELERRVYEAEFNAAVSARKVDPSERARFDGLFKAAGLEATLNFLGAAPVRDDRPASPVGAAPAQAGGVTVKSRDEDDLYSARVALEAGHITQKSYDAFIARR